MAEEEGSQKQAVTPFVEPFVETVEPAFTKDNVPDWFCAVPFANLNFYPDGKVGACREQNIYGATIGEMGKETWQEIWNGERIRAWRREFLTGNIKTCAEHIKLRRCNKIPSNQQLIPRIDLKEWQTRTPLRISPNFNSKCNIECNMCDVWSGPSGNYDKFEGFWESAEAEMFPHLEELEPWGGEPFVQRDTFHMMDYLGKVNPNAGWKFTTNGQWKFTKAIRDKFEKINVQSINFSIDAATAPTYELVRVKGDFAVVMQTIDDIIAYNEERKKSGRGFLVQINGLIQITNWFEMGDIVEYCESKGGLARFIQLLYHPYNLSLLSLPREERQEVVNFFEKNISPERLEKDCFRLMIPLRESLKGSAEVERGPVDLGRLKGSP